MVTRRAWRFRVEQQLWARLLVSADVEPLRPAQRFETKTQILTSSFAGGGGCSAGARRRSLLPPSRTDCRRAAAFLPTEPAPPRSLYAVNATHSSATLLWSEEGVVDFYQVLCRPCTANKELKVGGAESSVTGGSYVSVNPLCPPRPRSPSPPPPTC